MNVHSDEMVLLRAANPEPVQPNRGQIEVAAAALARILQEPLDPTPEAHGDGRQRGRGRFLGWSSRRLMIVFASLLVAGGAAFAATDPLGWWSAYPTYAKYGASLSKHVRTPSAQALVCTTSAGLRCVAASWEPGSTVPLVNGHHSAGQPYEFGSAVSPPGHGISRQALLAYVARRRAAGKLSATHAAQFRAAIAAVPNSFFTQFDANLRYSTVGAGGTTRHGLEQVPPAGVPALIVCVPAGSGLSCRDLNGDQHAPIGAGIYGAIPTKKWRYARVPPENWNLPPGVSYTPTEYRLLIDMLRFATVTHSVSSVGTTTVSPRTVSTPAGGG